MNKSVRTIQIKKEALKFSSAHMTVFSEFEKEALHGHNYSVELLIQFAQYSLDTMIPFSFLKAQMKKICTEWDEKVLLAKECPYFKILFENEEDIEFTLCKKRYVLPLTDVVLLPLDNIVSETLAEHFTTLLVELLRNQMQSTPGLSLIQNIEVKIYEIAGQGASFSIKI